MHEYDFQIEYQAGKDNLVADVLSRKSILPAVTLLQSSLAKVVRTTSHSYSFLQKVTTVLSTKPRSEKQMRLIEGFHLEDSILYFKD